MSEVTVYESICRCLRDKQIEFRQLHHEPTRTSEDAAKARGEDLRIGGKALLMKTDGEFRLFVLPADRRVDSGAIRRHLQLRKLRFATSDELQDLTNLVPGSVPPFGAPILPFPLFVDEAIRHNDRIAFNAGSLTDSIIMNTADYFSIAVPVDVFAFSVSVESSSNGDSN